MQSDETAVASATTGPESTDGNPPPRGLTAVDGILVGHDTLSERPTGCTVILAPAGAVGAVDVRGGAPATRETDLLRPENLVDTVHAVVLSGGSAYGLDSASGVMRHLEERGIGYPVRGAVVPIVVGASLLDLGVGGDAEAASIRPDGECGYRAAAAASGDPVAEGSVGAGAGATAGKMLGLESAIKTGVGSADIGLDDGLVIAALVAVNAFGDVVDPASGKIVAGARRVADGEADAAAAAGSLDGPFADARRLLRRGAQTGGAALENTTLAVVATNARLDKAQAFKVAQMAHAGFARALVPAHTIFDGDAIFVLATGALPGEVDDAAVSRIGALAAEVVADAIVRSATQATGAAGIPALGDL